MRLNGISRETVFFTACFLGISSALSFGYYWTYSSTLRLASCGYSLNLFMRSYFVCQFIAFAILWGIMISPKVFTLRTDIRVLSMLPGYWILYTYTFMTVTAPVIVALQLIFGISSCRRHILHFWPTVSSICSVMLSTLAMFYVVFSTFGLNKLGSILSQILHKIRCIKVHRRFHEIRKSFKTLKDQTEMFDIYFELSLAGVLPTDRLLPFERYTTCVLYHQEKLNPEVSLSCHFCSESILQKEKFVCLPHCLHTFHLLCLRSNLESDPRCCNSMCHRCFPGLLEIRAAFISNSVNMLSETQILDQRNELARVGKQEEEDEEDLPGPELLD